MPPQGGAHPTAPHPTKLGEVYNFDVKQLKTMSAADAASKIMTDLNTDGAPGLSQEEFRPLFDSVSAQLGMPPMDDDEFAKLWARESKDGVMLKA